MLLKGRRGIVMGVANEFSIATAIAKSLSEQGADLAISHLPDSSQGPKKILRRVESAVSGLNVKLIAPCDVQSDESMNAFFAQTKDSLNSIDFLVHSIAYAPIDDIQCELSDVSRAGFATAMDVSVFSFLRVAKLVRPHLSPGASLLCLTYYGGEKVVVGYNLMGLCKAALEAATRYLAFDFGKDKVRVNALSAGPIKTMAASAVGEIDMMLELYEKTSPLRRNVTAEEVAQAAAYLLSPLSSGVSGEVHHVDGGYHVMGSPASV